MLPNSIPPRSAWRHSLALFACALTTVGAIAPAAAAEFSEVILDPTAVRFVTGDAGAPHRLTVSGPAGFHSSRDSEGDSITLSLLGDKGALPKDGSYVWELVRLDAPSGTGSRTSGSFHVRSGRTLPSTGLDREGREAGTAAQPETIPAGGPTHVGNVSIQGRLCVGDQCDETIPLVFEAIRMLQNNPWIHAEDNSDMVTFPSNDWRLKLNDSTSLASGGANYAAFEDLGATGAESRLPLRVDAGAPTNSFRVDQSGRVGLGTATPGATLQVAGDVIVDGDFSSASSRDVKHRFASIEPRGVLDRLLELEIHEWSYRGDPLAARHMGPVAEDFSSVFSLGRDDRYVSPIDLSGVAFAAIQGLYDIVSEREAEIAELKRSRQALEGRLAELEALVARLAAVAVE